MKTSKTGLCLYRGLYWANQGLLQAFRALREVELDQEPALSLLPASALLKDRLRRTQAMIEETRALMNRNLAEWIEPNESFLARQAGVPDVRGFRKAKWRPGRSRKASGRRSNSASCRRQVSGHDCQQITR
jgi:hypothetical protein